MLRIFFFLIGFAFLTIGNTYIILYLNLISLGYNFIYYIHFITRRTECYYAVLGICIIVLTLTIKGGKKNDLHVWYYFKLPR